jgi:hypothetical protein
MGELPPSVLVFRAADIQRLLGISRRGSFELARKLGRRFGRRWLVPRVALEGWLLERDGKDGAS